MAEALARHMLDAETVAHGREALPVGARKALDALAGAAGRMPAAVFERRFGTLRPMGPGRLERERPWLSPANPTEVLWYRGFVYRAFDKSPSNPVEVIFIPPDLLANLPQVEAETAAAAAAPAQGVPQHAPPLPNESDALLDDVTSILAYIQNYEVRPRGDGGWNAEARTAMAPMLRDADGADTEMLSGRFGFLLNLIARLNWLRMKDRDLRLVPQLVTQWLQSSPQAQRQALYTAWRDDTAWNDLAHVHGIAFEMSHAWTNDPLRERAAILDLLVKWMAQSSAPAQDLEGFVEYVHSHSPDFARTDGRYDTWHIRDVNTNEYLTGFENWDRVEGALIRYIVTGPLRWLGLVNVESGRVSLSASAHLLSGEDVADAPDAAGTPAVRNDVFRLEPDGDVIVRSGARFERFQLARIANWSATRSEDFVYRLVPESVTAAIKQSIPAARILEFLEQRSNKPMPPNLIKAIKRLEQYGPEARMEQAYMLRTKDAATMDLLLNTHAVRKAMIERLSPTCALMRQRETRAVASAIIRTGLLIDV